MNPQEEYLMIVLNSNEIEIPVANISRKNFIKYEMLGHNKMRIYVKKLELINNTWEDVYYDFEIEPSNKHMLKVKNWN